jgi:hypothetical protein
MGSSGAAGGSGFGCTFGSAAAFTAGGCGEGAALAGSAGFGFAGAAGLRSTLRTKSAM